MTEKNNAPLKAKTKKVKKEKFKINYEEAASSENPHNDISNILKILGNQLQEVEHEIDLPSNGKLGYPKTIKIREMTTEDEKILLKGLYSNEDKALDKLLDRCVVTPFDKELLTDFDRSFILIEISTLTFPGPKKYDVPLANGNTVPVVIDVEDLTLTKLDDDVEYPFKVSLPISELDVYLKFQNTKMLREIEYFNKNYKDEHLKKIWVSIAKRIDRIEFTKDGTVVNVNNWLDYVKLLNVWKLQDTRVISNFISENISDKYGYKLEKEVYDPESGKTFTITINPLHFFRLGI